MQRAGRGGAQAGVAHQHRARLVDRQAGIVLAGFGDPGIGGVDDPVGPVDGEFVEMPSGRHGQHGLPPCGRHAFRHAGVARPAFERSRQRDAARPGRGIEREAHAAGDGLRQQARVGAELHIHGCPCRWYAMDVIKLLYCIEVKTGRQRTLARI
jgi:hypothetical protein